MNHPSQQLLPSGFIDPAIWDDATARRLLDRVGSGDPAAAVGASELAEVFLATVERLLAEGPERRAMLELLAPTSGLSPTGLAKGVDLLLRGAITPGARELFRRAGLLPPLRRPAVVVLAGNLPALAIQPLHCLLSRRSPIVVKSASSQPGFAPFFLRLLVERLPRLGEMLAALHWPGGTTSWERELYRQAGRVVVYGEQTTFDAVAAAISEDRQRGEAGDGTEDGAGNETEQRNHRCRPQLHPMGPRISVAFLDPNDSEDRDLLDGLALDIGLFDQRGCLSVRTVFTTADPDRVADRLARALRRVATELPPGPLPAATALAIREVRHLAILHGDHLAELEPEKGTVAVRSSAVGEPDAEDPASWMPGPGGRTVTVVPISSRERLPEVLRPLRGRIQGVALRSRATDTSAESTLEVELRELGIGRIAAPGSLQEADSTWINGSLDPLELTD